MTKKRWYKFWIRVYRGTYIITYKLLPYRLSEEQINVYFERWAIGIDDWYDSYGPVTCGFRKVNKNEVIKVGKVKK